MSDQPLSYVSSAVQVESPDELPAAQIKKNLAAIRLLREWMADESGYDEQAWPKLRKVLEDNVGHLSLFVEARPWRETAVS